MILNGHFNEKFGVCAFVCLFLFVCAHLIVLTVIMIAIYSNNSGGIQAKG